MPLNKKEKLLYNTLSDVLSIAGGGVGAAGGAGLGSIPGALMGAGLGKAAGKGLEQFAENVQGIKTEPIDLIKEIPVGATQEAGGQVLGKTAGLLASKLVDKIKPTSNEIRELVKTFRKTENGKPILEYHGSYTKIPKPRADAKTGVLGNEVFFTTEDKPLANMFAEYKLVKEAPFPNFQSPVVNEYYSKGGVPEIKLDRFNIYEVGEKIGLTPRQVDSALKYSEKNSANPMGRVYAEMVRELGSSQKMPLSIREAGQLASNMLKKEGIEKIVKPIDIGGEEIGHFYPERNLFYKENIDKKLQQELINQDINNKAKIVIDGLIKALQGPASRQGD